MHETAAAFQYQVNLLWGWTGSWDGTMPVRRAACADDAACCGSQICDKDFWHS
jgi:hypothetical protein